MPRATTPAADDSGFTPRQAVGLARAANCSKESLYKWSGDRDGLLETVVTFQASKVRPLGAGESALDAASYRRRLVTFAHELLSVLAGDVSLALNRLAMARPRTRNRRSAGCWSSAASIR
ncbi:hypothetical protein [Breoghania sp.]|uniref:hypothetical protein n=1 Tax=Breoghania sp. TaxID=2065378 RepID=UPI0026110AAE|nr:hypothetical protein [Breoghania sp.]MDJ0931202.1 hypothetical protein [Breoghania sp.]